MSAAAVVLALGALALLGACGNRDVITDDSCISPYSLTAGKGGSIAVGDSTFVLASIDGCARVPKVVGHWSVDRPDVASVRAIDDTTAMVVGRSPGIAAIGAVSSSGRDFPRAGVAVRAP